MPTEHDRKRILIVDDVPDNVDVLVEALSDYQRIVALDGEKALAKARVKPQPDLILLDVMMPGMDGFEVCRRLKQDEKTRPIPVIFVTALGEVADETRGFELGAVDYLTKPVRPPVVRARVKTHLQLEQAKADLRQLYEETFAGTIRLLSDILSMASPEAFSRTSRIGRLITQLAERLGVKVHTKLQLAAMLSHIGCIVLPPGLISKVATGKPLSLTERRLFEEHSDTAVKLISRIPRMTDVATMIQQQHPRYRNAERRQRDAPQDDVRLGGAMLRLAADFDLLTSRDDDSVALDKLRSEDFAHDPQLLTGLASALRLDQQGTQLETLAIAELAEGMVLAQDVRTSDESVVLVTKGSVLSRAMLLRLARFHDEGLLSDSILVRIPTRPKPK